MGQRQVRFLLITLIAAASAACGAGAPSVAPSAPVAAPSVAPSVAPTPSGDAVATITLDNNVQADGPGGSVSFSIANAGVGPALVNGIVLKEADGTVWLCEVVLESSPPHCAEPKLLVENWLPKDLAGEGVHEADGVRWQEHMQLFGDVRP
jgi:hypothetical protein